MFRVRNAEYLKATPQIQGWGSIYRDHLGGKDVAASFDSRWELELCNDLYVEQIWGFGGLLVASSY